MKKWLLSVIKFLLSRMVIVGALILAQAIVLLIFILWLSDYFAVMYGVLTLLSLLIVIALTNKDTSPAVKLAWTVPILLFPVFGGIFYILFGSQMPTKRFADRAYKVYGSTAHLLHQDAAITQKIEDENPQIAAQSKYLLDFSGFPIYQNTSTKYLTPGEQKWEYLLRELEKAEHYIFLEYFIIQEGKMWDSILEILHRKAQQGLDVRVIYDDIGCLQTLPYKYDQKLRKMGIKCAVFNPFTPSLSIRMNNRDHRKIVIIDGHTAFTGGINLADEYINVYPKHGHWKDASIMLKGDAVWNLTVLFLQAWNFCGNDEKDYKRYLPERHMKEEFIFNDGYVQPFGDNPLDGESVSAQVYMNIISRATEYVYINTPYLIIDSDLMTALELAAKSGVDVRIVTPHIADKWYVHQVTQTHYEPLIKAGVKIYEYTPGFIHSKTFVADDEVGVVGTINMDYRSLYMHFECGVWMYRSSALMEVKNDFLKTLEVCRQITEEDLRRIPFWKRISGSLLRMIAPLM